MPAPRARIDLPNTSTFTVVEGVEFLRVSRVAALSGIPQVVLSLAKKLVDDRKAAPGKTAGVGYALPTTELRNKRYDVHATMMRGLRRAVKAFAPGEGFVVKSCVEDQRLVFWLKPPTK